MNKISMVASGTKRDLQGDALSLEALLGFAERSKKSEYTQRYTIEHDNSIPPHGKVVGSEVHPTGDGHHELHNVVQMYDSSRQITLPDGVVAIEEFLSSDSRPFTVSESENLEKPLVLVDLHDFGSIEKGEKYLDELKSAIDIDHRYSARKAQFSEPVLQLVVPAFYIAAFFPYCKEIFGPFWKEFTGKMGARLGDKVVDKLSDEKFVTDLRENLRRMIQQSIASFLPERKRKQRTPEIIFQLDGEAQLQFVFQGNSVPEISNALLEPGSMETAIVFAHELQKKNRATFIQYRFVNGKWTFNYALTETGSAIATKETFKRRDRRWLSVTERARRKGLKMGVSISFDYNEYTYERASKDV